MIDTGRIRYSYLPIYPGTPPDFAFLVEVQAMGSDQLDEVFDLLDMTENQYLYQCYRQEDTPYPIKRFKLMVCFNEAKRAVAFKMRLPNDL